MNNQPILLIEDNLVAQIAATQMLRDAGFDVDTANTGAKGIELATSRYYHAIILDIGLPDMTGLDVAQQIRMWEARHGITQVRIIALSAQVDKQALPAYQLVGIDTVLEKPFQPAYVKELNYPKY